MSVGDIIIYTVELR